MHYCDHGDAQNTGRPDACRVRAERRRMEKKNIHYEWVDLARTFAILSVVLCHVTESSCIQFNPNILTGMGSSSRMILYICFTIGRTVGVPVFLMLTGYILLDKQYSSSDYAAFLKNKCLHLLFCTWIWYGIYEIYLVFVKHVPLTPVQIAGDFLFVRPIVLGHGWYMPMILGIYLLLPLAANALHSIDAKLLTVPVIIYIVYSFGFSFMNSAAQYVFGRGIDLRFSLGFSGGVYGIYVFMGYVIKKGAFRRIKTPLLALLFALSIVGAAYMQYLIFSRGQVYKLKYDFPTVLIGSVAFAEMLSRISKVRHAALFRWLACHAFGVYLTHLLIIRQIEIPIVSRRIPVPLKIGLLWSFTVVLSYAVVWLIGRIPKIGKYILYEK